MLTQIARSFAHLVHSKRTYEYRTAITSSQYVYKQRLINTVNVILFMINLSADAAPWHSISCKEIEKFPTL